MVYTTQYVRVGGKTFTPGEALPDGLPADKINRLIALGAAVDNGTPREPVPAEGVPGFAGEAEAEADAEEVIGGDEPEIAPDIDVLDGIISKPEEAAGAGKKGKTRRGGKK